MDKSWINQHRLHPEYIQGVKEFIKFACENKPLLNEVTCPCKRCRNVKLVEKGLLGEHLMINGFLPSYTSWIFHGENLSSPVPHNVNVGQTDSNDGDETYEMLYEGFGLPPPSFIHEIFSHEFSFWNLNCKLQACPLIQLLHHQTHYIGSRLWIHLVVIPLFGQHHINNNLMHFHPKRFTFQRKRRRIRRRRRTNKELVSQFQNATSEESKERIVANLANFAYDPYNYTFLRQVQSP